ncbi:MAG: hypothetical protein M1832_001435 [Thelocarpon impressellum]|nr:MAG: hypothetical protein M1832_001435 [Thelocarpon impressellum]
MSYYDNQTWANPQRQPGWEQPTPPPRSGASSAVQRDDSAAFGSQFEEVDRAIDNLVKSGKMFGAPGRRDSGPIMGGPRAFPEYDARAGGQMPQRHHSIGSDYDQGRSHSANNLQNFYANQRYQPRPNEAEQMMQAKRRMAAQRERELRNYHQEQQYNRNASQATSERSMSPNAMKEEERRDLIARQHRALYGNEAASYAENGSGAQASAAGARGPSPLTFDPFGMGQGQGQNPAQAGPADKNGPLSASEHAAPQPAGTGPSPAPQQHGQQRSRANSTSSPSSNPASFSLFDNAAQQSSRTSTSSPGGSPPRQAKSTAAVGAGVAPIGTRPAGGAQGQAGNPALSKRSTTPLPSPLSFGFSNNTNSGNNNGGATEDASANERSASAASNPNTPGAQEQGQGVGLGWGGKSGVWGNKGSLGVQASVWG